MTELDHELKGWVLGFVRERERVTVEDVREEFFPGEVALPYLYLDQLTRERQIFSIANGDLPTSWWAVIDPEEIRERKRAAAAARKPRALLRGQPMPITDAVGDRPGKYVPWRQLANGNTYLISEDDAERLFGITLRKFRKRLAGKCNDWGLMFSAPLPPGGTHLRFRIESRDDVES